MCYNKAIFKNCLSPIKTMIKQKGAKVKQTILPFVLFAEFVYGLRLNQRADF